MSDPSDLQSALVPPAGPAGTPVLDVRVHQTAYAEAARQIERWAEAGDSRAVFAANVHSLMEAYDDHGFRMILNRADLVTADGMPLVWMMRLKGVRKQQRTYGPTLMLHVLEMAARRNVPVGLYGGEPGTLTKLRERLQLQYPGLRIVYEFSPPFRPVTDPEILRIRDDVRSAGARILFVGLGCPRQERWIDAQRGHIRAVMIGVGAAFDFHAGVKPQAPPWMQGIGLEWLHRLATEPRRLWRRYARHIPRFVVLALADLRTTGKKTA